jgi:hypothetical protein
VFCTSSTSQAAIPFREKKQVSGSIDMVPPGTPEACKAEKQAIVA